MQLNLLPTVQQAIANLLTVYEPEFLRFGYSLFLSFATILIAWQGIKMMFSHDVLESVRSSLLPVLPRQLPPRRPARSR